MTDPATADNRKPYRPSKGFLVSLALILFVISFPFVVVRCIESQRDMLARQSEGRTNLAGIYVAEMAFYEENKRFGNFDEIGFSLTGKNNRYTYRIDPSGRPGTMIPAGIGGTTPDNTVVPAGISPDGQAFTATAAAQLDNDETIDQWHVNGIKQNLQNADTDDRRN